MKLQIITRVSASSYRECGLCWKLRLLEICCARGLIYYKLIKLSRLRKFIPPFIQIFITASNPLSTVVVKAVIPYSMLSCSSECSPFAEAAVGTRFFQPSLRSTQGPTQPAMRRWLNVKQGRYFRALVGKGRRLIPTLAINCLKVYFNSILNLS